MLDAAWKDLAKHRLSTALEDYNVAASLLNDGLYRVANNRAYYSIFHSMRTVLALEGKDFKKHSTLIGYFNQHYIHTGIFQKTLSKHIAKASIVRNESDYNDFYVVNKAETQQQVESAKTVYDSVSEYINQRFSEETT